MDEEITEMEGEWEKKKGRLRNDRVRMVVCSGPETEWGVRAWEFGKYRRQAVHKKCKILRGVSFGAGTAGVEVAVAVMRGSG